MRVTKGTQNSCGNNQGTNQGGKTTKLQLWHMRQEVEQKSKDKHNITKDDFMYKDDYSIR